LLEDWSAGRTSNRHQTSVDSCVATLSPDTSSSPRSLLHDHKGSAFASPRPEQDSLRFVTDGLQVFLPIFFYLNSSPICITCHLKVATADQPWGSANKACSFNKLASFEGPADIYSCCETKNCGLPEGQPARINSRWREAGSPSRTEADVLVGLVFLEVQKALEHLPEDRTIQLMTEGRNAAHCRNSGFAGKMSQIQFTDSPCGVWEGACLTFGTLY
uniref:ZP domain-containing protein n=1 Tax=Varanus komodoensis TaxID=61221 RepID=A0A8D2J8D2_VARKO